MLTITYCERIVGANMIPTLTPDELAKVEARFWSKTAEDPATSCLLWTGPVGSNGYGTFRITSTTCSDAHRVAFVLTHGAIPEGLVMRHQCHSPLCMRHLALGTLVDNSQDMIEAGRQPIGPGSKPRKLKPKDAVAIIGAWVGGVRRKDTARDHDVTLATVAMVRSGRVHVAAMEAHIDAVLAAGPSHVIAAALDPDALDPAA